MSKSSGYEPNVLEQRKSLTEESSAQSLDASSSLSSLHAPFATTLVKAGGDSLAKRRYVETLNQSPSKDQLWTELQELNARLIASEQETQRVKAVMSKQCASTLQIQMGQFRVAAGRFKQLAQETMEDEQSIYPIWCMSSK